MSVLKPQPVSVRLELPTCGVPIRTIFTLPKVRGKVSGKTDNQSATVMAEPRQNPGTAFER